jgi:hypothetical protein
VAVSLLLDSILYATCVYSFIPPDASATCDKLMILLFIAVKYFHFNTGKPQIPWPKLVL